MAHRPVYHSTLGWRVTKKKKVVFGRARWLVVVVLIGMMVVPGGEAFGISSWVWQDQGVSRGNTDADQAVGVPRRQPLHPYRCRANSAHTRQSRPDSGRGS